MNFRSYTETKIDALRLMPKQVTNPGARWSDKPRTRPAQRQRGFKVMGDKGARFSVYMRQNLTDENDFSCGIAYLPPNGQPLTLARYNGPSYVHGDIVWRPHIHRVTEEAIVTGRKPEREAEETDRYETLHGVLACLIDDFNLKGIAAEPDQLEPPL